MRRPALSDELYVLRLVISRLDGAGIPYMLSGSTALGVYATPRMTRDIDIVVALESDAADRFTQLFAEDFYCDAEAVRRSVAARGIVNLIHLERVVKVDMIVRKDAPYRRLEFERRRQARIDGVDIWVVSPEDLILSNLDSADTPPDVLTRYHDMLLARSASDRVVMACEMFDLARATVLASLPADADDAARRVHLFMRIYRKDFDPETAARIITRLNSSTLHHP